MSKTHVKDSSVCSLVPPEVALGTGSLMSEIKGSPSILFHTGQHHVSQLIDRHRRPAHPSPAPRPSPRGQDEWKGYFSQLLRLSVLHRYSLRWMELVRFVSFFCRSFFSSSSHLLSALPSFLPASLVLESFLLSIFQAVLLLLPVPCVPCSSQKSAPPIKDLKSSQGVEEAQV